ncbi:MAG: LytTR family DNA-binding domain-containing protein [Desulfobacteraceae bacterium]|jgi:DNA-binding LytR/AlgR family response regulator
MTYRAIIADDEKELRVYLRSLLSRVWPDLEIRGEAKNGKEVLDLVESEHPNIVFLDIKMPGHTGMEVAKRIVGLTYIVFVTAYDRYALEAFERDAVDYLLKPVSEKRLRQTVTRLKERLKADSSPPAQLTAVVEQLLTRVSPKKENGYLQLIKAQHGDGVRLIPVEEIDYFKADNKYIQVMTGEGEWLIRKSIKELVDELDPARFWQIHRSTIVNVSKIDKVSHSVTGRGVIKLKERGELLTVSRNYLHLFKQM